MRYVDPNGYGKQDPNQKQRKESNWGRFRKENKEQKNEVLNERIAEKGKYCIKGKGI